MALAAGDDLSVEIQIRALLDGTGFEQAKANLGGMGAAATTATLPIKTAAAATEVLGVKQHVSAREIKICTKELLVSAGAAEGAGAAGRFAAHGFKALGNSAEYANLALSGFGFALVFLLPRLLEWYHKSEDVKGSQDALNDAMDITIEKLQEVMDKAPGVSQVLADLFKVMKDAERQKQTDGLKLMGERLAAIREELEDGDLNRLLEQAVGRDLKFFPELREAVETAKALRAEQAKIITTARALEEAILEGTTVQGMANRILGEGIKPAKKNQAAIDALAASKKFANEQEMEALIDISGMQDKDFKKRVENMSAEQIKLLATSALKRQEADDTVAAEEKKAVATANTIGMYGQAAGALSNLFGKNKALAIAGAILSTYEGAALALVDKTIPNTFARIAAVTAVIATGLAQVQQIRKTNPAVGFDDPFSDLVARRLGRKSADDFVKHFGGTFMQGLNNFGQATQNVTHINRGVTNNLGPVSGIIGSTPASFYRALERHMTMATRFRARTSIGR